jgi:hypothetical protein
MFKVSVSVESARFFRRFAEKQGGKIDLILSQAIPALGEKVCFESQITKNILGFGQIVSVDTDSAVASVGEIYD